VQTGDTIGALAIIYGVDTSAIFKLNPAIPNSDTAPISPGQVIMLPGQPNNINVTPSLKIIPDSELVDSPAAISFSVDQYVKYLPGFLRVYSETYDGRLMSGVDIVNFLALSNSINPRLLLALLEYRGGWLTNPVPGPDQLNYPLGYKAKGYEGLFRQLTWAASTLNYGYYGWKYRGLRLFTLTDGSRLATAPSLNAGTAAIQYLLSRTVDRATWQHDVGTAGLYATYLALFGDPFQYAIEPLIPPNLTQPTMQLPFPQNETWYFTGGPHGGWDAASGWAAIDFAPPAPPDALVTAQGACYVSPNTALAAAGGLVVRSGDGAVVISLDRQSDERIGWSLVYLHIADPDRVAAGTIVKPGDVIGHPSCQGFDLNAAATHLHVARRYNGEWLPADCWGCTPDVSTPPFILGGWKVVGLPAQIYQGTLEKADQPVVRADQGRDVAGNQISW
jgi:murein DD-endopeptidase MepM/ murein hydrolase activator NlpD